MEKEEKSSSNDDEFKVGEEGGGGVFSSLPFVLTDSSYILNRESNERV